MLTNMNCTIFFFLFERLPRAASLGCFCFVFIHQKLILLFIYCKMSLDNVSYGPKQGAHSSDGSVVFRGLDRCLIEFLICFS